MELISDEYRRLNQEMHETKPAYGISGREYLDEVVGLCKSMETKDVLDYGCGKSTLAMNLPFTISQYDPAIPRFSDLPEPADIVVCTDVLEHIEPELIGNVLDHLQALTKRMLFAVIHTEDSNKHLPDGRNAHILKETPRWWLNALWDRFTIHNFILGEHGIKILATPLEKTTNGKVQHNA